MESVARKQGIGAGPVRSVLNEDAPALKEWPQAPAAPVHDQAALPCSNSQVAANIALIDAALGVQRGLIERLEDRLHIIMRPDAPVGVQKGEDTTKPRIMHSVAASQLEDLAAAIARHNDRLVDLMSRLEV